MKCTQICFECLMTKPFIELCKMIDNGKIKCDQGKEILLNELIKYCKERIEK